MQKDNQPGVTINATMYNKAIGLNELVVAINVPVKISVLRTLNLDPSLVATSLKLVGKTA